MSPVDRGALYRGVRERVTALARELTPDQQAAPVPACPGWTVRDVLAHLAGVTADATSANMAGAPGPAWTAAQVDARRGRSVEAILDEWNRLGPGFEAVLSAPGEGLIDAAVIDAASHEQDVRNAIGRPGARDNEAIVWAAGRLARRTANAFAAAALPPVLLVTENGEQVLGEGSPTATWRTSRYELFRSVLGRRSRDQVAATWDGADPNPYLDLLFVFGPADAHVVE